MALDNYDAETALDAYYPNRTTRQQARVWAKEKLIHTAKESGLLDFFEGDGSDPTALSGYDASKVWLRVSAGVTTAAGTVRVWNGSSPASSLSNWPEMDGLTFVTKYIYPKLPAISAALTDGSITPNLLNLKVIDKDLTTPPGSPTTGDRYIVATGGSGAWSGHDGALATWDGSAWVFSGPTEGVVVWVADEDQIYAYSGSAWTEESRSTDASTLTSGTLPAARLPASGVTAATYGSGYQIPQITLDAYGRATAAANLAVRGWTNRDATLSSSDTITTAHNGYTIELTGTTGGTLTVGAASGYDAGHVTVFVNNSTRAFTLTVSGLSDRRIWPGQSVVLMKTSSGTWFRDKAERYVPGGQLYWYVDPASGNNANDGIHDGAGGRLATVGEAFDRCRDQIDVRGLPPIVQILDGSTVTENAIWVYPGPLGSNQVYVEGSAVTWSVSSGAAILTRDNGIVTVRARDIGVGRLKFTSSGSGCYGLYCSQQSVLDIGNGIEFGQFTSGTAIEIYDASLNVNTGANMWLSGDGSVFCNCTKGSLTWSGSTAFTAIGSRAWTLWLQARFQTFASFGASAAALSGTLTGQRYATSYGSTVSLGGSTLPGSTSGTTDAGTFGVTV